MRAEPVAIGQLPELGPAAVTMGVFDGVHRGHRLLLDTTRAAASEHDAASVALVFDPHPDEVLHAGRQVPRLAPLDENLRLIAAAGIDHAIPIRFDDALRALAPEAFLAALARSLELRSLVMTAASAFGRGRSGTPDRMRALGAERRFDVRICQPLEVASEVVSSSRVRAALLDGDVASATDLLGHPPALIGTVIHGDGRGRDLGFPTANLAFDYRPLLPPLGIYLGLVDVPERGVGPGHPALISIGVRPTFHSAAGVLVEVYLLDWSGDLYGARLRVELVGRLREERRFDDVDQLVQQMRRDEATARAVLERDR
jgi:riboflavin kinase/FMN adenylyltransferase